MDAITGGLGTKLTLAPNAAVRDLALNSTGSTLYLAGASTKIGTTTRYNFASVGAASRALTAWNPNIHASGWGIALSPNNTTVYMATADGTRGVLVIQATPAGLGVGGDLPRTNGVRHNEFALFRGTT